MNHDLLNWLLEKHGLSPVKDDPWNSFIDQYCTSPMRDDLTPVQRIAVL